MTEDDIRRMLREMRDDPVPADSLARVRLAVNERTAAKSRLPWFAAVAAAAALAMLLVMFRPEPVSVPAAPTALKPIPEIATVNSQPPLKKAAIAKRSKPVRPSVSPKADPLVVRIETEDPNVVILLLGD
jgi:hypothetical protein